MIVNGCFLRTSKEKGAILADFDRPEGGENERRTARRLVQDRPGGGAVLDLPELR